ncbi:hypothetical protein EHI52_01840 [Mesomycoplasma hyopneumoniae]|uniref:hypothetical protein n=1 Tax=Mesomycoplasma hyopneumoniae TaxID=2099 RepID=UPI001082B0AD|nr:hypothetical protein [Mesomycoplasma hyopneumoniae]MXR33967.1 hypothetical protein [Mesomycoplasma hyopneumoniae]MXR34879.1 hypothetical protein [Mesomycoplasma hyopneumoniae]QBY87487.1 hypothetical protein E5E95_00935 [Mesomycoplasma hyopneumoniae]QEA02375.1 hypothetical protein EHI52_01840 [Mesomycoplasma hyopneumoniae]
MKNRKNISSFLGIFASIILVPITSFLMLSCEGNQAIKMNNRKFLSSQKIGSSDFLNPSNKIDIDSTITSKDTKIDNNLNNHTSESNDEFDSKLRGAKRKVKDDFFNNVILKKVNDNFEEYQQKYFMHTYLLNENTLQYIDEFDKKFSNDFFSYLDDSQLSENEKKIRKENKEKFKNFFTSNKPTNYILKTKEEFDNLNTSILKPIFQDYLNKFFSNKNIEQVLNEYNFYYFAGNSVIYSDYLRKQDIGWWYFDSIKSKKLYFVVPQRPDEIPARLWYHGAQISIIALKKSENVSFFKSSDIGKVIESVQV